MVGSKMSSANNTFQLNMKGKYVYVYKKYLTNYNL